MRRRSLLLLAAGLPVAAAKKPGSVAGIPWEVIEDKIRGGFLGQVIGDLNGLQHEMKYIAEPGNVAEYTPALPDGAWTDDDTDIEWVYILEIERTGNLRIPSKRITELWKRHINRRIWCSHLYLRQLMDLGIDPPLTGRVEINPWADFNLSGQFVSESWGLISPGMPQTAARIGAWYTHVSVEGEAVQSTQMLDAMIATAFLTGDMERILDAGAAALDPASVMSGILADVRRWHQQNPDDWRATRRLTKEKYCKYGGDDMRDRNGVWLNGASTLGALLYGHGDFVETLRHAFNFGWDADNNAAASGAIVGVIKGNQWMLSRGWNIRDVFRNTSRDNMPDDETITKFGGRLIQLAARNVAEHGGGIEQPANIEPLKHPPLDLKREVESGIAVDASPRGAYLAICLDYAPELKVKYPAQWPKAIAALNGYPKVLQAMFHEAPFPAGDHIRAKALAAGVAKPARAKT